MHIRGHKAPKEWNKASDVFDNVSFDDVFALKQLTEENPKTIDTVLTALDEAYDFIVSHKAVSHNKKSKPFKWSKSADHILDFAKRFCRKTSRPDLTNFRFA